MSKLNSIFKAGTVLVGVAISPAMSATLDTPQLSAAQVSVIADKIAKLKYQQERALASGWTTAKKVAEFICRPLATTQIKARFKDADRVFLGTDDPATLHLLSDRQLEGSGQFRAGDDWQLFTFSCTLNPRSGTAAIFKMKLASNPASAHPTGQIAGPDD